MLYNLSKKSYKTSTLMRILSLGLKRTGVKITSEEIIQVGLFSKRMFIDSIEKISYETIRAGNSMSYAYVITDNRGKIMSLSYSLLDGITFQELFRDLMKLNPKIILSEKLKIFLSEEIVEKELKFDFEVHKGEFLSETKNYLKNIPR